MSGVLLPAVSVPAPLKSKAGFSFAELLRRGVRADVVVLLEAEVLHDEIAVEAFASTPRPPSTWLSYAS